VIHNAKINWMLCPSSPLPQQEILRTNQKTNSTVPSYVGISGATNHNQNRVSTEPPFWETRLKQAATSKNAQVTGPATPAGSQQSFGGMLVPNECYGIAAALDGTSNTMVVSEIADYFYSRDSVNAQRSRIRIDASFANGGSGNFTGGWWFVGCGPPSGANYGAIFGQPANNAPFYKAYNVTTIRAYNGGGAPANACIGYNGRGTDYNVGRGRNDVTTQRQGIGQHQGNNPLVSAHPNVVLAVFMDGHTQSLSKNTPAPIVKRLATRDDGQQISDF
jgi:hypothetical protein